MSTSRQAGTDGMDPRTQVGDIVEYVRNGRRYRFRVDVIGQRHVMGAAVAVDTNKPIRHGSVGVNRSAPREDLRTIAAGRMTHAAALREHEQRTASPLRCSAGLVAWPYDGHCILAPGHRGPCDRPQVHRLGR